MNTLAAAFGILCALHVIQGITGEQDEKRRTLGMLRLGRNYNRGIRGFRMLRLGKRSDVDSGLRKLLFSLAESKNFDERQAPLPRYGRELGYDDGADSLPIDGELYAPLRPVPRLGRFRRSVDLENDEKDEYTKAVPMPRIGKDTDEVSERGLNIPRFGREPDLYYDMPEVNRRAMHLLRLGKRRMKMLRLGKRGRGMTMLRLGRSSDDQVDKKSS